MSTAKTVISEADYKSGVKGVKWDKRDLCWSAQWYENGKRIHRRFYVKDHGFEEAKRLAIEARRDAEGRGEVGLTAVCEHQSGVKGVGWHNGTWEATWYEKGERMRKRFHVRKYGDKEAKRLAIEHRLEMEKKFYVFM